MRVCCSNEFFAERMAKRDSLWYLDGFVKVMVGVTACQGILTELGEGGIVRDDLDLFLWTTCFGR